MVKGALKSPHGQIGQIIRTFREKTGRSLSDIASSAGISISMISQIERGVVSPSIDTLVEVCRVLDLDISWLFGRLAQKSPVRIQRPGQRLTSRGDGACYEQLSVSVDNSHPADMFLLELEPKKQAGLNGRGHEGVEMGYVLNGSAKLTIDNDEYRLECGDSVSFLSHLPHSLVNDTEKMFRSVWTVLPPHKDYLGIIN
jgi:transcriptional regulator with XRE-family HTH domain